MMDTFQKQDVLKACVMTDDLISRDCSAPTEPRARSAAQGNNACLYLIAAVALVFSLAVAVTAISIGIARAGALPPPFSQASFLG